MIENVRPKLEYISVFNCFEIINIKTGQITVAAVIKRLFPPYTNNFIRILLD